MKKVNVKISLEAYCKCPHCGAFEDVIDNVREYLDETLSCIDADVEVECSECHQVFIVENVNN